MPYPLQSAMQPRLFVLRAQAYVSLFGCSPKYMVDNVVGIQLYGYQQWSLGGSYRSFAICFDQSPLQSKPASSGIPPPPPQHIYTVSNILDLLIGTPQSRRIHAPPALPAPRVVPPQSRRNAGLTPRGSDPELYGEGGDEFDEDSAQYTPSVFSQPSDASGIFTYEGPITLETMEKMTPDDLIKVSV